jgi:predicted glycosyltransferase
MEGKLETATSDLSNKMLGEVEFGHQKRAIFFVFDGGTGIGHLRRLATIAKHLQGEFACLIVTGHRAAANWFVPPECEYVHVPAWDSLLAEKAAYWGRKPFLEGSPQVVTEFRRQMLQGIVESFRPDVILVDHLPLGMREELASIIAQTPCRKYLVTRAIQNETENLNQLLLAGQANQALELFYDRVFVAIDDRIFDFRRQYPQLSGISKKICTVGYVVEPVSASHISQLRKQRGLSANDLWAVASAGGGQHGEQLIEASCKLAHHFPQVAFDVVVGPRSKLPNNNFVGISSGPSNLRLHRELPNLYEMHAAADIVISSGGYNSLLEALQGKAHVICVPSRKDERDEQYVHAVKLGQYASIDVSTDVLQLPQMFEKAIYTLGRQEQTDNRKALNFSGAASIRRLLRDDLGLEFR